MNLILFLFLCEVEWVTILNVIRVPFSDLVVDELLAEDLMGLSLAYEVKDVAEYLCLLLHHSLYCR